MDQKGASFTTRPLSIGIGTGLDKDDRTCPSRLRGNADCGDPFLGAPEDSPVELDLSHKLELEDSIEVTDALWLSRREDPSPVLKCGPDSMLDLLVSC
ncbi:hypothetical protein BGZ96_008696 [Linnemannia gamsii]|uniref:Uncharacterized protein n=1 Tax=Linnemannia gamsii TaxID=64522 RepID=A0ABQ7JYP7_9FUNG|nr:hypothetical protein BGZ96_008696 [Linnemannia gamsii]